MPLIKAYYCTYTKRMFKETNKAQYIKHLRRLSTVKMLYSRRFHERLDRARTQLINALQEQAGLEEIMQFIIDHQELLLIYKFLIRNFSHTKFSDSRVNADRPDRVNALQKLRSGKERIMVAPIVELICEVDRCSVAGRKAEPLHYAADIETDTSDEMFAGFQVSTRVTFGESSSTENVLKMAERNGHDGLSRISLPHYSDYQLCRSDVDLGDESGFLDGDMLHTGSASFRRADPLLLLADDFPALKELETILSLKDCSEKIRFTVTRSKGECDYNFAMTMNQFFKACEEL